MEGIATAGTFSVVNSTISDNRGHLFSAPNTYIGNGGGIYLFHGDNTKNTIINSTISGNQVVIDSPVCEEEQFIMLGGVIPVNVCLA